MIIHVEFDGTICPDTRLAQPHSAPDESVVADLRGYRSRGATIVVTSGRAGEEWSGGWKTRHAARLICAYLDRFEIPYDEVLVGRPICDVVIDRRAVDPGLAEARSDEQLRSGIEPGSAALPQVAPLAEPPHGVVPIPGSTRHAPLRDHAPVFVYHMHGGIGRVRGVEPCVETDFLPASHEKLAHLHLDVPFAVDGPDWNRALSDAQRLARQIGCDGIVIDTSSCRPGRGGSCQLVLCAIRVVGTLRRSAS